MQKNHITGKNSYMRLFNVKKIFLHIFSFAAGVLNGMLGVGAGTVFLAIMYKIESTEKAHGSVEMFVLPLCITSLLLTPKSIDVSAVSIIFGCTVGAAIGTLLLKKLSGKILKIVFSCVLIFCGVRAFL